MIIKASQRGGGRALADHLMNMTDNEFVSVHSVTGFIAGDVKGAFLEVEAVSRATKCVQPFFSVSISPPKEAAVLTADFEAAIEAMAERLNLDHQPRVVLFHEKEGRKHCHVVFSRITEEMRAVQLSYFKEKLVALSREQYLSHGWDLPAGLIDKSLSDPTNFGLEEWQVAKRADRDPREIKSVLKQCWTRSDGTQAFAAALRGYGFWLSQGDRRGFVALDYLGNIYSLSRWLDVKPKELKGRLGDPEKLPKADETKRLIETTMDDLKRRLLDEVRGQKAAALEPLSQERRRIVLRQRAERQDLHHRHKVEEVAAIAANAALRRRGLAAVFDWVTGRRRKLQRQLEAKLFEMRRQQEATTLALHTSQRSARAPVQELIRQTRARFARDWSVVMAGGAMRNVDTHHDPADHSPNGGNSKIAREQDHELEP